MKKRPTPQKAESSAAVRSRLILPGKLPARHNTAIAEILARLLSGEAMTSADSLKACSTMRLAARIGELREYGWDITVETVSAPCQDGRVADVARYSLPSAVIHEARAAGAGTWCSSVRKARAARRAKVAQARREAERRNRARGRNLPPPGQLGFSWD